MGPPEAPFLPSPPWLLGPRLDPGPLFVTGTIGPGQSLTRSSGNPVISVSGPVSAFLAADPGIVPFDRVYDEYFSLVGTPGSAAGCARARAG